MDDDIYHWALVYGWPSHGRRESKLSPKYITWIAQWTTLALFHMAFGVDPGRCLYDFPIWSLCQEPTRVF